jgi:hypothetical protein
VDEALQHPLKVVRPDHTNPTCICSPESQSPGTTTKEKPDISLTEAERQAAFISE